MNPETLEALLLVSTQLKDVAAALYLLADTLVSQTLHAVPEEPPKEPLDPSPMADALRCQKLEAIAAAPPDTRADEVPVGPVVKSRGHRIDFLVETTNQAFILRALFEAGGTLSQQQLTEAVGGEHHSLSAAITRLWRRGYIDASDRAAIRFVSDWGLPPRFVGVGGSLRPPEVEIVASRITKVLSGVTIPLTEKQVVALVDRKQTLVLKALYNLVRTGAVTKSKKGYVLA